MFGREFYLIEKMFEKREKRIKHHQLCDLKGTLGLNIIH